MNIRVLTISREVDDDISGKQGSVTSALRLTFCKSFLCDMLNVNWSLVIVYYIAIENSI